MRTRWSCADLSLVLPFPVTDVRLMPQDELIAFQQNYSTLTFSLPRLQGHQIIAIARVASGTTASE